MKSIGFFWTNSKEENECCRKCPHLKDDTTQSNSASKEQTGDEFEFQINLWNSDVKSTVTNEKYRFRAVDFGIVCPLSIRKFVLLLPFKADISEFHDLVRCLSLDTDLLCTVFNEDLKSTSEPSKSYHTIEGGKIKLLMYELSKENIEEFIYDEQTGVTQITITINSDFNTESFRDYRLFVRFRIMLKSFLAFAKKKKVSNDWLQSAFSSSYLFDIRLNDVRELSKKKKELVEFKGFKLPKFSKVHFFYMADSEESVENGSSIKLDKRLLENERWHSYLGDKIEFVSENVAHHWKRKEEFKLGLEKVNTQNLQNTNLQFKPSIQPVKNFTLFFKTEFSDCQKMRLLIYILIVVLLGTIASAIIAFMDSLIPKDFEYCWGIWLVVTLGLIFLLNILLLGSVKKTK